ncbi:hypothetical protein AFB00_18785 [Pseudonocardia sp. HH130630-07]|nr:hypothetical protein AFB00_18785 [Pseudonocardia sp. HH130630-07]
MTKPGWSGDKPLTRGDLELLTTVEHDGSPANTGGAHTVDIPADRSGYHVIYAVWDVADTPNAFYNVIDVQVGGGGGDSGSGDSGSTASEPAKTQPEKKTEPKKSEPTESDASKPAATKPEESGSDHSDHSDHSSHSDSSQSTAPETGTYAADGASGQHDHHAHGSVPAGDGPGVPATGGTSTAWSPTASYQAGDQVQHDGKTYRALQAYTGYGDPNWILAPSLWQQVG